jgi:hypothetical protein
MIIFDYRVESASASRQPLALATMTAVREHWSICQLIANFAAGTATGQLFNIHCSKNLSS